MLLVLNLSPFIQIRKMLHPLQPLLHKLYVKCFLKAPYWRRTARYEWKKQYQLRLVNRYIIKCPDSKNRSDNSASCCLFRSMVLGVMVMELVKEFRYSYPV